MKIGIDARFYGPTGGGGLGRYIKEIVDHLELTDFKNDYVIFLRKENWDDYQPQNSKFKKILAPYQWYGWKEQLLMPWKINKEKLDLVHFPHFNVPLFYRGDFVLTVHDLILLKFPSQKASTLAPIYFKFKYLMYKFVIKSALNRAKKIIAPSQFVKDDIIHYFKISQDKIIVIYEGLTDINKKNSFGENQYMKNVDKVADKEFKIGYNSNINIQMQGSDTINNDANLRMKRESTNMIMESHGLKEDDRYILYVGNAYPHKNLERLVGAFSLILKKGKDKDLKLVMVGVKNYFYKKVIEYVQNSFPELNGRVIFWGYATDQELQNLYSHAQVYAFPSLQEGFGLPPLEAMSFGVPVASAKNSSLPEILGDAALYFDAENEHNMAEIILKVIENNKLKGELTEKGLARVKKYNWRTAAHETFNVYENYGGNKI